MRFNIVRKLYVLIVLVLICTVFSCSRQDEASILLDNGIRLVYKQIPHARVVTLLVNVKAGSILETENTRGVAQLTAQCLFHKSKSYSKIKKTIDSFGAHYNASTSNQDFCTFSLTAGEPYLDSMVTIIADVIQFPVFNDSLVRLSKQRLKIQHIQHGVGMQEHLKKTFLQHAFHVHPYRYFHKAEVNDIYNLELNDVQSFYDNAYTPENISIIITGPKSSYRGISQLKNILQDYQKSSKEQFTWESEPEQLSPRKIKRTHSYGEQFAFVAVGWRAPSIRNADTFTMDVILAVLGMGESSRLNKHIRNKNPDVYYVWAEYLTPRDPGVFMINVICDPAAVEKIEKAILKECAILRKDQITPFDIERAVQLFEAQEAYQWENTESAAYYLGYWTVMKDYNFAKNYLRQIKSVSLDDIQQVANTYFGKETYTSVIMLPESGGE